MSQYSLKELNKYLPEGAFGILLPLFHRQKLNIVISKERNTKLGDFRPPVNGNPARISINHNLNPFSFLITLLHETAHLFTWADFKNRVRPHGSEWKRKFSEISFPFVEQGIFPADIMEPLMDYLNNPKASTYSHHKLSGALANYDKEQELILLSSIPFGDIFSLKNGKRFKKISLIRKNYKCLNLDNKKFYSVSPSAIVFPSESGEK